MVYLLGFGACVSFYFMYRNKHKISFELLKYYTYLDEYFSQYCNTHESLFLYPSADSNILCETSNLQTALININQSKFDFFIIKDHLVSKREGKNNKKSKTFFSIFKIDSSFSLNSDIYDLMVSKLQNKEENIVNNTDSNNTDSNNIDSNNTESNNTESNNTDSNNSESNNSNKLESQSDTNLTIFGLNRNIPIPKIELGVKFQSFCEYVDNLFFKNKIILFDQIEWNAPIIASSINIIDKNNIYTFREYDITSFMLSILRKDEITYLDNSVKNKKLWIYIFNYLYKEKNIFIPCLLKDIENYELSWTIILDDCSILEGTDIKIDLSNI